MIRPVTIIMGFAALLLAVSTALCLPALAQTATNSYGATYTPPGQTVSAPSLPTNGNQGIPVIEHKAAPPELPRRGVPGKPSDAQFGELIYGGVTTGRTNFSSIDNMSDNATAYGVTFGTNATRFIGIEFGYSYQTAQLYLGLEDRAEGKVVTPFTRTRQTNPDADPPINNYDTEITAHVLSVEGQFHLTDVTNWFRPFAGLGLGYKEIKIAEDFPVGTTGGINSVMKQGSVGLTAGIGSKFRIAEKFQVSGAFRLFIPVSTSDPTLSAQTIRRNNGRVGTFGDGSDPPGSGNGPGSDGLAEELAQNLFQRSDQKITSTPLSQLVISVQYVF